MITQLTLKEIEYIAVRLAQEILSFNEPIPNFTSRFPNILESCLMAPSQTYAGKPLYQGLIAKTTVLFYLMIKNHPFQNGNKRIAMTTLFVFLHKNKKWLKIDTTELYNFTMWVAQSNPVLKDETVLAIKKLLNKYLIEL
jgi:death-on-curing family protein